MAVNNSTARELTPKEIVSALDKYIIGQEEAKKCAAVAIRNRWRRLQLQPYLQDEVAPKNIIMIGPTGVGKTEIARRLANLMSAPFLKVEATKYTEVGYHGKDVESMIRDLTEVAYRMVQNEEGKKVWKKAEVNAEEKLLDVLLPGSSPNIVKKQSSPDADSDSKDNSLLATREKFREKLKDGELDEKYVELDVDEKYSPMMQVFSNAGFEEYGFDMQNMLGGLFPTKRTLKKMKVSDARNVIIAKEAEKLIDWSYVREQAVFQAENNGIIFIDELDKIITTGSSSGPDVSRGGVQRDLLPIVEGASVMTRHGIIRTDHILFISAGAFHSVKPADLMPELQGRFPIRVELKSLNKHDFKRILTEPHNSLTRQYRELLATEKVKIRFLDDAIDVIADIAEKINSDTQDIGARRLHTIMEKLLEEISFNAPTMKGKTVVIDSAYVKEKLSGVVENDDLSRYIL